MNKTSVAMGAAFLAMALGGCSGEDNVLHSCSEGIRSAKVTTDRDGAGDQARPVVSVFLFERHGTIGSAASKKPIYEAKKARPTPAEINGTVAVAEAYCVSGTVPKPEMN